MNDHVHYMLRLARDREHWLRLAREAQFAENKPFCVAQARRCNRLLVDALKRY